jgi:hypothetical protein
MMTSEDMRAVPEPTDPDALAVYLDSLVDEQASMRDAVRQATMNATDLTRGQVWEVAIRIMREAAERCLSSEADRLVFRTQPISPNGEDGRTHGHDVYAPGQGYRLNRDPSEGGAAVGRRPESELSSDFSRG